MYILCEIHIFRFWIIYQNEYDRKYSPFILIRVANFRMESNKIEKNERTHLIFQTFFSAFYSIIIIMNWFEFFFWSICGYFFCCCWIRSYVVFTLKSLNRLFYIFCHTFIDFRPVSKRWRRISSRERYSIGVVCSENAHTENIEKMIFVFYCLWSFD